MGNLSEHFDQKDFVCRCPECKGQEYKIHLGLIGALEMIAEHFKKKVEVLSGFWCESYYESLKKDKRSFHLKGKAAHIRIEGVSPAEIFKFAESIPELRGVGLYIKEGFVHVDTRPEEKKGMWVKDGGKYIPLTPEVRRKYNL